MAYKLYLYSDSTNCVECTSILYYLVINRIAVAEYIQDSI